MTNAKENSDERSGRIAMIGAFVGAILGLMLISSVYIIAGNLRDKDAKEMAYQRLIDAKESPENSMSNNLSKVAKNALQDDEITTKEYSDISDAYKLFVAQRNKQLLAD